MKRFSFNPYLVLAWTVVVIAIGALALTESLDVICVYVTPLVVLLSCFWPARWRVRSWLPLNLVVVPLLLVVSGSLIFSTWPLRLTFWSAKTAMNSVAARIDQGEVVSGSIRIGPYGVKKVETSRDGIVCFWTDLGLGGRGGFVRTSLSKVESQFNVWSATAMDSNWVYVIEY
jgi:hypothetical protein